MAEIKDGGPAFPRIDVEHYPAGYGHGAHCEANSKAGMSLRDYFAGQALVGLLAQETEEWSAADALNASRAYSIADAMLKAREANRHG